MSDEAESQLVLDRIIRTILRTAASDRSAAAKFALLAVTGAILDRTRLESWQTSRDLSRRLYDEFRSPTGCYFAFSALTEIGDAPFELRDSIARRILKLACDTKYSLSPLVLGDLYQRSLLDDDVRRNHGIFYTPAKVADFLVRETLVSNGGLIKGTVCDPACGCGILPLFALRRIIASSAEFLSFDTQCELLTTRIFGTDLDRNAVTICRATLALELLSNVGLRDVTFGPAELVNIQTHDALLETASAKFDYVLANPPFVGSKRLTLSQGIAWKQRLAERYETAWGAFDLFVPFTQRCLESLVPGGRLGLLVPDKLSSSDYAAKLRRLILERTTIERFIDLSAAKLFAKAHVYPQLFVLTNRVAPAGHALSCSVAAHVDELDAPLAVTSQPQRSLSDAGFRWGGGQALTLRVPTEALGSRAKIHGGTIGFAASRTLAALCEEAAAPASESWNFVTSGNIARRCITLGNVRFMGRTFEQPRLVADRLKLSAHRLRLYRREKIVISGMSKRLKCAHDHQGLALGVAVLAITDFEDDPRYLLVLLNSKLLTFLYLTGGAVRRHDAGYFAVTKSRLQSLPIRTLLQDDTEGRHLAERLMAAFDLPVDESDREIDRLTYELYGLTSHEIELVEATFAQTAKR